MFPTAMARFVGVKNLSRIVKITAPNEVGVMRIA
jgi:hypothetical protein